MASSEGMSTKSDSPLVSSLGALFAEAGLRVELAGRDEREKRRQLAFYDEVLLALIQLSLPASTNKLPAPPNGLRPIFALPLPAKTKKTSAEEEEEEEEGLNEPEDLVGAAPPRLLSLLVSSLHVSLDASYIAPRLDDATASSQQSQWGGYSTIPIPSTDTEDASYQTPLASTSYQHDVTPMYATSWAGDQVPPPPKPESQKNRKQRKSQRARRRTITASDAHDVESGEHAVQERGAEIRLVVQGNEKRWVVEWRCEVPVVYMRTRHPSPALSLTSSLALRLMPMQLHRVSDAKGLPTRYLDGLSPPSNSAIEALYSHDLLSALSEGPSYPDESPAERAARANASLARLPLGKLPSNVLGSRLVTPMRGTKDIDRLLQRQRAILDGVRTPTVTSRRASQSQELDVGDGLQLTDVADMPPSSASRGGNSTFDSPRLDGPDDEGRGGLGQEVRLLRRSARKVMDVRNAIAVRMRVAVVPGIRSTAEDGNDDDEEDEGEGRSVSPCLVLCVEVENTSGSGLQFLLESIKVQVAQPVNVSLHQQRASLDVPVEAALVPGGYKSLPLTIEQGEQRNLLYHVQFHSSLSHNAEDDAASPASLLAEVQRQRHVSINIEGKPVLKSVLANTEEVSYSPIASYSSTWSCHLDLSRQLQHVALDLVAASGSGHFTLGKVQNPTQIVRTGHRSLVTPTAAVPPLAYNDSDSVGQRLSARRSNVLTVKPPPPIRTASAAASLESPSPASASSATSYRPFPSPGSAQMPRTPFELRIPSSLTLRTPTAVPSGASNDSGLATPRPNLRASSASWQSDSHIALHRDTNAQFEHPHQPWELDTVDEPTSGRRGSLLGQGLLARARMRAASAASARAAPTAFLSTAAMRRQAPTKLSGINSSSADSKLTTSSLSTTYSAKEDGRSMAGQRDVTPTPLQLHQRPSLHGENAAERAEANKLLPLDGYHSKATKGQSDLVRQLVLGASHLRGILIDVDLVAVPSPPEAKAGADERFFDVRLTLSNRSYETKTLIVGWVHRHPVSLLSPQRRASTLEARTRKAGVDDEEVWLKKKSTALEGAKLRSALRLSDDEVHVGPIAPGTTELASLRISVVGVGSEEQGQRSVIGLGGLRVLDLDSGQEKILDDLQRLVL